MPKELRDFPRPPQDNGRGLHGSLDAGWNGGEQGYEYWINLLVEMNIKWFKVIDDSGKSMPLCEKLLAAGIFPIARILRRDPPPNDTPEPNPGHLGPMEEATIRRLVSIGVRYFETNNEPDLARTWKNNAIPGNSIEAAKLVALNWLFDARFILAAGGLPGLPAISNDGKMDLMGALVALGRQEILLDGCWIALHNYSRNRPLNYPDDPVNRFGQSIDRDHYNVQAQTRWVWFDTATGKTDSIERINELRANSANPASTIQQDHACFREFEYYNSLAMKYLGRSIPIISTEGGALVGRREDLRYPRLTPGTHRDHTVAIYDFMQHQAPDYYFAATPSMLIESDERPADAWHSAFWQRAFQDAPFGFDGIPNQVIPGTRIGEHLPVIDAVKAMQSLARRLPGAQPAPPERPIFSTPPKPAPPKARPVQPPVSVPPPPPPQKIEPAAPDVTAPKIEPAKPSVSAPPPSLKTEPVQPVASVPAAPPRVEPEQPIISAPPLKKVEPTEPVVSKPKVEPAQPIISTPSLKVEPAGPIVTTPKAEPAQPIVSAPPPRKVEPAEPVVSAPKVEPVKPVVTMPPPPPKTIEPVLPVVSVPPPPPPKIQPATEQPKPAEFPSWLRDEQPIQPPPVVEKKYDVPPPPPPPEFAERKIETPPPPEIPLPETAASFDLPPIPDDLEWDWRLDALGVTIEPADVKPDQPFWHLVRADYQGPGESDGGNEILYVVVDQQNKPLTFQRVVQSSASNKINATTNEQGLARIAMDQSFAPAEGEHGAYTASVDGLPCDRVIGLGLPMNQRVNFVLTWKRGIATFFGAK